ncbi:flavonoid 3'-monooxygenase CYP75B137-like [Tasmannia lanceolata]|uniref:flavonoid 3'-monooxygenase CYP75B137-like n=1 Tax=Tasmannia lanceolata TaxID=3420 RepID=UPI0040642203
MDLLTPTTLLKFSIASSIAVVLISWLVRRIMNTINGTLPLPPGPMGLPLIGNLPFIEPDLHRYFLKLSKIYGPIFKLRLGNKLCIVLHSPSVVKEALKDNDITFANHDKLAGAEIITYGGNDIVWNPYGPEWRMLRRVSVHDFINNTTLEVGRAFRRKEIRRMVNTLYHHAGTPVNIGDYTTQTIFNTMTSMLWGGTVGKDTKVASEFKEVLAGIVDLLGQPNISDLFPIIARFDLQGVERKMKGLMSWFDQIFDDILDQRIEMNKATGDDKGETKDFLDILLQLKNGADPKTVLTMSHVKALMLDLAIGGAETTSTTSEWAMTELMTHPEVTEKLQQELETVVGKDDIVEEHHISKLHYLDAVVREILRMHPGLPLLIPHMPSESCQVGGYTIPKGSRVFINVWAIQRDPSVWDDPLEFKPERWFNPNNANVELNGVDFRFLPFGSGRRTCAGFTLAERMLTYNLSSLLHSFNWRLPDGGKLEHEEKFGLVLKKKNPLIVIPTPRLSNPGLYNNA